MMYVFWLLVAVAFGIGWYSGSIAGDGKRAVLRSEVADEMLENQVLKSRLRFVEMELIGLQTAVRKMAVPRDVIAYRLEVLEGFMKGQKERMAVVASRSVSRGSDEQSAATEERTRLDDRDCVYCSGPCDAGGICLGCFGVATGRGQKNILECLDSSGGLRQHNGQ